MDETQSIWDYMEENFLNKATHTFPSQGPRRSSRRTSKISSTKDEEDYLNNDKLRPNLNRQLYELSREQDTKLINDKVIVVDEPGKGQGLRAKRDLAKGTSIGVYYGPLQKEKDLEHDDLNSYAQALPLASDFVVNPRLWIEELRYKPIPATMNTGNNQENNVDANTVVPTLLKDENGNEFTLFLYGLETNRPITAGEFLNRSYGNEFTID